MSLYKASVRSLGYLYNVRTFRRNDILMALTIHTKERRKKNEIVYKSIPMEYSYYYLYVSPYKVEDWNSYKSCYEPCWTSEDHKFFALRRFI